MCYIVVLFHDGIGYTYQTNSKCAWAFSALPKYYKSLETAKKIAHKVSNAYVCNKVVVYKVDMSDRLNTCTYNKWNKEERERIVYEIEKKKC